MPKISSFEEMRDWLQEKPSDWAQIVAVRAAMRALPHLDRVSEEWLALHAQLPFRAVIISWASRNYPAHEMRKAVRAARSAASIVRNSTVASAAAAAAGAAAFAASRAARAARPSGLAAAIWQSIENDCIWLIAQDDESAASRIMTRRSLWLGQPPLEWMEHWRRLEQDLLAINSNYHVWIDWYNRRIRGERAAFDIPGDRYRKEDKAILRRLAGATDADFWGKGSEHVNATLQGWLDEARARVTPPSPEIDARIPKQEAGAIAYGVNEQGKLDRLPPADQVHLRDLPNQRRNYADMRVVALELLGEGQRLGPRLLTGMERFTRSLPEHFEDAEAYLVWRDGNTLRRLYRAHRLVADVREPDPARLEAVVAEGLGGLLDLFNNFAFGDDGIRAKDEARISPQERESAAAEFAAAKPLVEAILAAPEIATRPAHDDIKADAENAGLPADDPYAGQAQDQANRTRRNWIAGLLGGGSRALAEAYTSSKEVRSGAERAVGALIVSELFGVTSVSSPIIQFIATQAPVLQSYVAVAFSSFPHLAELIDRIVGLCQRYMKP